MSDNKQLKLETALRWGLLLFYLNIISPPADQTYARTTTVSVECNLNNKRTMDWLKCKNAGESADQPKTLRLMLTHPVLLVINLR